MATEIYTLAQLQVMLSQSLRLLNNAQDMGDEEAEQLWALRVAELETIVEERKRSGERS